MIQSQSFYISGLEDPEEARKSAFGAMGMFVVTFVASCFGIWYDSQHKPDPADADGNESGYHLSTDQTTYGTSA
jgi:hypothetical protein